MTVQWPATLSKTDATQEKMKTSFLSVWLTHFPWLKLAINLDPNIKPIDQTLASGPMTVPALVKKLLCQHFDPLFKTRTVFEKDSMYAHM